MAYKYRPASRDRVVSDVPLHSDPEVWGPSFWFTLHNSAVGYPENPTNHVRERMKKFIEGIPVMVPCEKCYHHAFEYIYSRRDDMDDIVSGRRKLFNFFVDFHNQVNERNDKPLFDYDKAWDMYYNRNFVEYCVYYEKTPVDKKN